MAYVKEATEEYVEQRIASALSGAMSGMFVVANALPQAGEAGKIYLVPNNGGESGNARDEYMWVNGAWELIGSTLVDLSGYYDKTAADGRFVQKEAGKGLSANDYTNGDKAKVAAALTAHQDISGKANATDLPYALVTPGEWEFSGLPGDEIGTSMSYREDEGWTLYLSYEGGESDSVGPVSGTDSDLVVEFTERHITATRASLPGHLLDRANNIVTVTENTTLTIPPFVAGKVRDLLVRLAFGTIAEGASVPTVIFQGQGVEAPGETAAISFVTDGGEFPVPDFGGDWWYSLTECAPHVFAVSLKQLQSVSQTQTQGGS